MPESNTEKGNNLTDKQIQDLKDKTLEENEWILQ